MGFLEDLFDAFTGDSDRPQRSIERVDDEGYVYTYNWFSGGWEPKQGLFGPAQELDLFGNPRVDRDWLGDPIADKNWQGEEIHASEGEPLFRLTLDADGEE